MSPRRTRILRPTALLLLLLLLTIAILIIPLYYHRHYDDRDKSFKAPWSQAKDQQRIFRPQHMVKAPMVQPLESSPPEQANAIPDRAHFVYMMSQPEAELGLEFSQALCVFAARYYWRPRQMFLHTNAVDDAIARARNGQSGKWSRLVLGLPEMTVHRVELPIKADNGVEIRKMEHKSDFVRVKAVRDYGGVYLDFDAHLLRDIRPLLRAGFNAVGGRQANELLVSGSFMAKKSATLVNWWYEEMHRVFDGRWTTHSNELMTRIGTSLVPHAGEMLILDRAALAPGGWSKPDCRTLFQSHDYSHPSWLQDYSDTYVLHAFSPRRFHYRIKGFSDITPRYVLSNRSNFALAVFPVAKYMLDQGLIDVDDSHLGI
ncbi:hypothetical protein XA68_11305 [Ophiocordyceps unilateralis]|uniref:Glycosyl transferase n=1 Tax=Ophiocordyceps unilateralis TaxID=268505 RepID=A0A2A9PFP2_OPHUN|nr:hypothetical protein XA68_11305 [Ophiocordyceps unilateralis]